MTERILIEKDEDWFEDGWTSVPNVVLRDKGLSWEARGLYAYLASHRSTFVVTIETLMEAGGSGRDRTRRILRELEESGFLTRKQEQDRSGRFTMPTYRLHTKPRSAPVTENPSTVHPTAVEPEAVHPTAANTTPYKKTNSKNTKNYKKTKEEDIEPLFAVSVQASSGPGFDEFYAAYPKKVGKEAARRAWKKALNITDTMTIVEGAKRYAASLHGSDKTFVKHPATWLNAGCWDDEIYEPKQSFGISGYRNPTDQSVYDVPLASVTRDSWS